MKCILYTPPSPIDREIELITQMMDAGADYLYLRRDTADDAYWMAYVEQIPMGHAEKIICQQFRVLHEMELGGFHFNGDMLRGMTPADLGENLSMLRLSGRKSSATVRSLADLQALDGKFDILLVAPLFPSISKPGHEQAWDFEALKAYLQERKSATEVFALGGINAEKVDMAHLLGFDGIAILGAVWQQGSDPLRNFKAIHERC
jgi:thiamine-phosphate pyrophosphorylase